MGELAATRTREDYERLYDWCRAGYDEIIDFITTDEFKSAHAELMALPLEQRPQFVVDVFLNDAELERRGIRRPRDLHILRSAFGDRRPTLFCVKKWLPPELRMFWENVNITFDNEFEDDTIPRDEQAWRPPLPVEIQHEYLSGNLSEEVVEQIIKELEPSTVLGL